MIQPWMSAAALDACPDAKAKGAGAPFSDGEYFNGMINPLLPFQPAAVLWHRAWFPSMGGGSWICLSVQLANEIANNLQLHAAQV